MLLAMSIKMDDFQILFSVKSYIKALVMWGMNPYFLHCISYMCRIYTQKYSPPIYHAKIWAGFNNSV